MREITTAKNIKQERWRMPKAWEEGGEKPDMPPTASCDDKLWKRLVAYFVTDAAKQKVHR